MIRHLICAVQFLTNIPIPVNVIKENKDFARSMLFYPVVGLFIGGFCVGCYKISSNFFAPAVSLVFAYVAGILLTGGLHLDGFADVCDGFYAGTNKDEILMIMKDAHIGVMAVIGIFCLLLLKLSFLFSLLLKGKVIEGFLFAPVVSRWVMTMAASFYPYARSEGTAKSFVENAGVTEAVVSSLFLAVIAYQIMRVNGLFISIGSLVVALLFMVWVKKKIGGITGDVLGALNEISEVSALFLMQFSFPIVSVIK